MPKPNFSTVSLENLVIGGCEQLNFPDDIEYEKQHIWRDLKSLRSIDLWNVPNLVSLPGGLKSVPPLEAVRIWNCPNLMILPEELQLQSLIIADCPKLSERFRDNVAADWSKIAHIPHIEIDYLGIQAGGRFQF